MTTAASVRDTRRITEHDADFRRLHQQTVTALRGSLRQFARDLRSMPTQDAQHAFITRHTDILRQAYYDAHQAGASDFDVLHHSQADTHALLPRKTRLTRVLSFYLPSVAKMAAEGAQAYRDGQRKAFDEPPSPYDDPSNAYQTYPYRQSDPLNDWVQGDDLSNRVVLQGNVVWPAIQDGYVDAGVADGRYTKIAWELEPLAMHCSDCPEMAAGSPYDAPGSGGNELWTTPGDGNTMCGANCRCSLRYVDAGGGTLGVDETPAPSMPQDGANLVNVLPASMPSLDKLDGDFTVSMPNRSTYTNNQRQARNAIQSALRAWDRVRGDLPSIDPFDPEASLDLPEWDELTDEQQEALEDFLNSIISWNVATNLANLDSLSLTELVATWRFYSPDQQRVPKGAPGAGRFQDEGKGRMSGVTHVGHHEDGMSGGGGGSHDLHGQAMPFTHADFEAARAIGSEISAPGSVNVVTKLSINGHEYYAKVRQGDDGGKGALAAEMARNEAATVAALHALGMGNLGPEAAYHVVDSQGRHYAVVRAIPGKDADDYDEATIAQHVPSEQFAQLTLAEYLTGMMDRHGGNLKYDEATHQLREFDFGWGLKPHAELGDYQAPHGRLMMVASTKSQSIWSMQRGAWRFPRAMVERTLSHAERAGHALDQFGLKDEERSAFDARVRVVRKWLADHPGYPTLGDLERTVRQEGTK